MATLVDALLISLGMDVTDFKKGAKETQQALKKTREEADRHTKEMEARAKAAAAAYGKIKTEILGMLTAALSAGGVARFVEKITESDAATGRLATNLGMATKHLSAWENLAPNFGSSAADIDSAFRNVFKIAQDLKNLGDSPAMGPLSMLFAKAGMTDQFARFVELGKSGQIEEMLKLLQKVVTLSPDKGSALALLEQGGFSEHTFNFMREIANQLEGQLQLMEELNAASDRDKQLAIERERAWNHLGNAVEAYGRKLLNASGATPFMEWLADLIDPNKPTGPFSAIDRVLGIDHPVTLFGAPKGAGAGGPSGAPKAPGGMSREQWLSALESKWGLPKGLLAGVIRQEGWKGKDSKAGAQGPMQFIPSTGAAYGLSTRADREDFGKSTEAGAHYLHDLLMQYHGDLRSALRAYNGGWGGVAGLYPESVNYANSIMGRMAKAGSSTEVHIDQVTINTQATDAKGIAKDFAGGVRESYMVAADASVGAQ